MQPDWWAKEYEELRSQQPARFEALRAQLGLTPDLEDPPAPGASADDVAFEDLTPGSLAVMTPEDWSAHLMEHGRKHVENMLQQAPATFTDPAQQLTYATVLISWLAYEGPLPPPLKTPRQRKRANAKEKKQQSGGGSGVAQVEGWLPARTDANAFPPLGGA